LFKSETLFKLEMPCSLWANNSMTKLTQIISILFFLGFSATGFCQSTEDQIKIVMPTDARVIRVDAKIDQWVYAGDILAVLKDSKGAKFKFRAGVSGQLVFWRLQNLKHYGAGETVGILRVAPVITEQISSIESVVALPAFDKMLLNLFNSTGLAGLIRGQGLDWTEGLGRLIMIGVGLGLLYLGIRRQFEPLLLVPIGFGAVLSNIPLAGLSEPGGLLYYIYEIGISTGIFPLIIFMGVGTMTDFGPMLANPKTAFVFEKFILFATSAAIGYNVLMFFVSIMILVLSGLKPCAIKSSAFSSANCDVFSNVMSFFAQNFSSSVSWKYIFTPNLS